MIEQKRVERARPLELMACAKDLADRGDMEAARRLLQEARGDLSRIPPAYDAMLGRFWLHADAGTAVEYLTHARDSYGDRIPVGVRRDLGVALFQAGRIEAAGREFHMVEQTGKKMGRPSCRAAIEAFARSAGPELDSGPPTAYCVLAQAKALAEAKDFAAARALLAGHHDAWECVPTAYDAMLGSLSLRSGDREAAITFLTHARDSCQGRVPSNIRQPLGVALFELGRFDEAVRELDLAYADGAPINRAELLIALSIHRRDRGGEPVDTTFPGDLSFVDPDRKLIYVSIPKNASSLLKAAYVFNSAHRAEYLSSGQTVHEYCNRIRRAVSHADLKTNEDYFRFVVLRDPLRRLLSAYLDKFVRNGMKLMDKDPFVWLQVSRTIRDAQAAMGLQYDPVRSITFEEFAQHVSTMDDVRCNMHWMPQTHMVGTDLSVYNHVGTFERLQETLDMLSSLFGYAPIENLGPYMRVGDKHNTRYSETADLREPHRALPAELEAYEDGLPMPELFYTRQLSRLVQQRYADDLALHAAASGTR